MLWAAFGVRIFSDNVAEWQIETVKKYAARLKEGEIDQSELAPAEKDDQKRLRKQWIDETTKGFKEVLRREREDRVEHAQNLLREYYNVSSTNCN